MGKQISDRTKKILGISILVLLVMSMMVAVVSAQPTRGRDDDDDDRDGWRDGGRNCRWVCDDWDRQRFCKDWDWRCFGRR